MIAFFGRRLLWIVPIILGALTLLFLLNESSLQRQTDRIFSEEELLVLSIEEQVVLQQDIMHRNGFDLPVFYFSIHNKGWRPSLRRQFPVSDYNFVRSLSAITLNSESTLALGKRILRVKKSLKQSDRYNYRLHQAINDDDARNFVRELNKTPENQLNDELREINSAIQTQIANRSILEALPLVSWNGINNRFHCFISTMFMSGNLRSNVDGVPVFKKIWPAVGITLFISLVSLLFLVCIGILLGNYIFKRIGSWSANLAQSILYVFYAIPLFWLATLILYAGGVFPSALSAGLPVIQPGETPSLSTFLRLDNIGFLILPIITIILSEVAVIAIQLYRAMLATAQKKFVLAAHSRGLEKDVVLLKYNRPFSLFTILTIIGNSIPNLISGSVVIELIFNIPGMGRLLWDSLYAYDWSVVSGLLLVGILFSVLGQLFTDTAYYYFNPELRSNI